MGHSRRKTELRENITRSGDRPLATDNQHLLTARTDKNGLVEMAEARLHARQVCNERHIEMRLLADWFPSIAGALEKNHARLRQSGSVNLLFLIPFVKTFWN